MSTAAEHHTQLIKRAAHELGFMYCGISEADFLEEEAPRLERWLKRNMHGEMAYMEKWFDKRLDPRLVVDGAKSVVSLMLNYYPEEQQSDADAPKLSKYAYGRDYHWVIKWKLKELLKIIRAEIGEVAGRGFIDTAPVMDKAWAARGGLGWIGKNTNLINKGSGSFFFVAELILDLELVPDGPVKDYCGTCTACIDACPTDAIVEPYVVDGSKCISYYTIELKGAIPADVKGQFDNWMFGCDVCQDVCPWNRFSKPHTEPELNPHPDLLGMTRQDWEEITEEVFREVFHESAVNRTKFEGLKRNLAFLKNT